MSLGLAELGLAKLGPSIDSNSYRQGIGLIEVILYCYLLWY